MKKAYKKPLVAMESFGVTQMLTTCSLLIGFGDENCVLNDMHSTDNMKDLAYDGFFNAGDCDWYPDHLDFDDGVCYHTSVNLAFTS